MGNLNSHPAIVVGRVVVVWLIPLVFLPFLIWVERKASAFIQDRTGPNRAAIMGIRLGGVLHSLADVLKLLAKEDVIPARVNRFYYKMAPMMAIVMAQLLFAVMPLADNLPLGGHDDVVLQALQLDIGLLWPLAVGALMVYSIVLAGWGSNNKYGTLGALRASAQMVSYEVALGLSIMGTIMIYGSLDLNEIVRAQGGLLWGFLPRWGIFLQPLGFALFLCAAFAETNRTPFDLPERDAEIVAGFHTEYSAVRFAFFFMGEYVHIVVVSALAATLFLGGWQVPWVSTTTLRDNALIVLDVMLTGLFVLSIVIVGLAFRWSRSLRTRYSDARRREGRFWGGQFAIVGIGALAALTLVQGRTLPSWLPLALTAVLQFTCFIVKVLFIALSFIWVRWTLPSFRYDQLMSLGWKHLMPWALVNITVTGVVMLLLRNGS